MPTTAFCSTSQTAARVKLGPTSVSIRSVLQQHLASQATQTLEKTATKLRNSGLLKSRAARLWKEVCQSYKIGTKASNMYLHVIPKDISARALTIDEAGLRFTVVITSQAHMSQVESKAVCPSLPGQLTLLEQSLD